MRSLADELGFAELSGIRRQRHDWMRDASLELAARRPARALQAYDDANCLSVHVDRTATLSAAADNYVQQSQASTSSEALKSQLLITARNRDVSELNRLVRERLQTTGRLGADVVSIKALPRGRSDGHEPVETPLAINDRVIFGARLDLRGKTIFNSDVARIMAIDPHPDNPQITFVLDRLGDDGGPLSFMVRYRELISKTGETRFPELQHAFAVTAHAAQGATVERAIVVDVDGLTAEASFVAMTRHRDHLALHLNAARSLTRHRREVVRLSRAHRMVEDAESDDQPIALTPLERSDAIALATSRMMRSEGDQNPSSYIYDRSTWINAVDPVEEFKRQAKRHCGRAVVGRLTPKEPDIAVYGDPTAISNAETRRLDAIPIMSSEALSAFDLIADGPSLRHSGSGEAIAIDDGRPVWSDSQRVKLETSRALNDHMLVQITIVLFARPLAWARSWVRRAFGLGDLNPIAAAARRDSDPMQSGARLGKDAPIWDMSIAVASELQSARNARHRPNSKAQLRHDDALLTRQRSRGERQRSRFASWTTLSQADRGRSNELPASPPDIEIERPDDPRRNRRFARWDRWTSHNDASTGLEAVQATVSSVAARLRRHARWQRWASCDAAIMDQTRAEIDIATPEKELTADKTSAQSATAQFIEPFQFDDTIIEKSSVDSSENAASTGSRVTRRRLMDASKLARSDLLNKLQHSFDKRMRASKGDFRDRRTWGGLDHIARLNEIDAEFSLLQKEATKAFGALFSIQLDTLKQAKKDQLADFTVQYAELADLYRSRLAALWTNEPAVISHPMPVATERRMTFEETRVVLAQAIRALGDDRSAEVHLKVAETLKPFADLESANLMACLAMARQSINSQDSSPDARSEGTTHAMAKAIEAVSLMLKSHAEAKGAIRTRPLDAVERDPNTRR